MRTIEVKLDGTGARVAIVASRFNHVISHRLVDGCLARLAELGCEHIDLMWVPGAFEIPLAAQKAASTGRYDALITLGAVIRGGTPHFDYVCNGVTDGLGRLGLETRLPIAFGVLTTDDLEQAMARAAAPGESGSNKGADAAEVAIEMAALIRAIDQPENAGG